MESISKDDFMSYENIRRSGVTNMFDTVTVKKYTGLDKIKIMNIMKNYGSLIKKYGDDF